MKFVKRLSCLVAGFVVGAAISAVSVLAADNAPVMPDDDDLLIEEAAVYSAPVISESSSRYTTDRVNFRTGPGTDKAVITVLPEGTEVKFLAYSAEGTDVRAWSEVVFGDTRGFIKTEYLSSKPYIAPPITQKESAVEMMTWENVKQILRLGVDIPVLDIRTGITYAVRSFSNGQHADVEPVTKEDTATLKKTYGGAWDWDGRPVIVTIAGHRIAAAINGMPHGGGVINGNGMDGQVCLHFKGSHVHNGNKSYERELQTVVQKAYDLTR